MTSVFSADCHFTDYSAIGRNVFMEVIYAKPSCSETVAGKYLQHTRLTMVVTFCGQHFVYRVD